MHLLDVFPFFFHSPPSFLFIFILYPPFLCLSEVQLPNPEQVLTRWPKKLFRQVPFFNLWEFVCGMCGLYVMQWKERRRKENGRVRWTIKKTNLTADSSGLFYCNNLMTKPTHALPNSIRNSSTTLHSGGNGSADTSFLLLCGARVRRQGRKKHMERCQNILELEKCGWKVGVLRFTFMKYRQVLEVSWPGHHMPDPVLWKKQRCLDCKRLGDTWREVGCRQGRDESGLAAVAICILWWNESPCDAPNSRMHE